MKNFLRRAALLLALLTVMTVVLAACGGENTSGEDSKEAVSGDASGESSASAEESKTASEHGQDESSTEAGGESEEESREPVSEPSGTEESKENPGTSEEPEPSESSEEPDDPDDPDDPEEPEEPVIEPYAVSIGCSYTSTGTVGESYPDQNKAELTDGLHAPTTCSFYEDRLVGYSSDTVVTIDLGKVYTTVHRFEVGYLCTNDAGIGALGSVTVEYSEDGKTWKTAGNCTIPAFEDYQMLTAYLETSGMLTCRYVKFNLKKSRSWQFLDELSVIADVERGGAGTSWGSVIKAAYKTDTAKDDAKAAALKSVTTGKPDRTLNHINIARGASYDLTRSAISAFPNTDGKLTDGLTGISPDEGRFVGLDGKTPGGITVRFSEIQNDICGFAFHAFHSTATDALLPPCVTILVSADGSQWTEVGRMYAPLITGELYTFLLELPVTVKAKFVRFSLSGTDCRMILADEVSVFAYREEEESTSFYPNVKFPKPDNAYWPSSEKDYATVQNLILGKTQQIRCYHDMAVSDDGNNTAVTSKIMTDGNIATGNNIHNGQFFKFNGCSGREVFYDLGKISTVQSCTAGFTHRPEWGVYAPGVVEVSLSMDGKNWYKAGEIKFSPNREGIFRSTLTLKTPVAARFVCFSFPVSPWVGIDELEVKGTKKVATGVKTADKAGLSKADVGVEGSGSDWAGPSSDLLGGVHDIFLVYHKHNAARTYNDLITEVAYVDENGKIKDTMFDGFLFLMSGGFPSGLGGGTGGVLNYNKSDMEWLIETLFKNGQNVMALEDTVGKVKSELGLPASYKVKYFVSLYYPSCKDFGDIDGDGKSENVNTIDGKTKVLKWWIKQFEAERKKHSPQNVEFGGYYWYNESLSSEQIPMTKACAELIHSYGSQFFWIPYFSAGGVAEWEKYGFDIACLQPNYAFNLEVPDSRVRAAAKLARSYGMCLEIEMSEGAAGDERYRLKYYEYLKQGAKMGYMTEATHMYYMGMYIHQIANSKNPAVRQIYDYTYQFIKGTLKISPKAIADKSFSFGKNKVSTGTLMENMNGKVRFMLVESPKHGSVTIQKDGTFAYFPNAGYTGTDEFLFAYAENLDFSEPCKVKIKIS